MAKNDQQEAFEKLLSSVLGRVVDFLNRFAEAKNAALLTFSSAWILASTTLLTGTALNDDWRIGFAVALPLFVAAALIAVVSFLPKTHLPNFHKDPEQARALLYFGDAASFAPAAYRERIRERYYPPDGESATRNYLDDLSIQIAVNSQITARKLRFFNTGAYAVLLAFVALGVPAVRILWRIVFPYIGAPA